MHHDCIRPPPPPLVQGTFNILGRLPVFSRVSGLNTTAMPGVAREVARRHPRADSSC